MLPWFCDAWFFQEWLRLSPKPTDPFSSWISLHALPPEGGKDTLLLMAAFHVKYYSYLRLREAWLLQEWLRRWRLIPTDPSVYSK